MINLAVTGALAPAAAVPTPRHTLRYLGDDVLRTSAEKADWANLPPMLLHDMERLIQKENAQGLAAPQLGVSLQVAIIKIGREYRTIINPDDFRFTDESVLGEEGCLSIPGFYTQIPRARTIDFTYTDRHGGHHRLVLNGHDARVAQHEFDHLKGILITDYLSRQQRRKAERMVEAFLKKRKRP